MEAGNAAKKHLRGAVTFIRQEKIEPQSPRAFYVYARAVQVLFSIGAAIELHRLGYEMKKLR